MNETDKDTLCRRIVETVGDAVIFADRDGIIRLWNQAAEGIFGYTEAEAVGQSLDPIIPERQRALHWKGYGKAMPVRRQRDAVRSRGYHGGAHSTGELADGSNPPDEVRETPRSLAGRMVIALLPNPMADRL